MDYSKSSPGEVRQLIREGKITTQTSGMCDGFAQGNLLIIPREHAYDFLLFTQRNPKPCPILEVGDVGSRLVKTMADNADIATDIPKYRLWEYGELKGEYTHGDSRFDFSFLLEGKRCFLEAKGVTLENDGVCAFPDAPTERGAKHIRGLTEAARAGYGAYILFVIQMSDVKYIRPHDETDPEFGRALREAAKNGVHILAMDCAITPATMDIRLPGLGTL